MTFATSSIAKPVDFLRDAAGFHIVGNGPPESRISDRRGLVTVGFNNSHMLDGCLELTIRNRRISRAARPFSVDMPSDPATGLALEIALEAHASTLAEALGAFPSSGLCFTSLAFEHASLLRISRMPLRPSLRRRPGMPPRVPQASTFHNWLGERRLAFSLLGDHSGPDARWPGLLLSCPLTSPLPATKIRTNPYEALLQAFTRKDVHFWQLIASIDAEDWLHVLTAERLRNLEPFFYLDRQRTKTSNWWLYDNAISISVDQIHEKLAWCQQSILGTARPG